MPFQEKLFMKLVLKSKYVYILSKLGKVFNELTNIIPIYED